MHFSFAPKSLRWIMVIEPSLAIRQVLAVSLVQQGWSVVTHDDPTCALADLYAPRPGLPAPDAVILDLALHSALDGFAVTRNIRNTAPHPDLRRVPIVALSTEDRIATRMKARVVGIQQVLQKPFDIEELLKHLRTMTVPSAPCS